MENQNQNRSDKSQASAVSPERISHLASDLSKRIIGAIGQINEINANTRLLSINAQIEAGRAGGTIGAAFNVVASAMHDLSNRTSGVAKEMANQTKASIDELEHISQKLAIDVRGTRLSDLALNNIDVIDRCLYERSCDCRWWATDASCVQALMQNTPESIRFCSQRLGVILNAYTVYFDLVLCDRSGKVIANGRPNKYRSVGNLCGKSDWFTSAIKTASGDEFGFQSAHRSNLVDNQSSLIYSAAVRKNGEAKGEILGALGVIFNWDALAHKIVTSVPLSVEEKSSTRVCIVDDQCNLLADSNGKALLETLQLPEKQKLFAMKKGFVNANVGGSPVCVAHALSPGFETYATGWHSLIIQPLSRPSVQQKLAA
ncbi:MAG TPA: methyl-accepting chemotaxis protein, partial [Tepidisphaeraceae bacterium]|nr:methyl-accepting chemotaxis protein [Tepidisphaeraceae bacterium]